MLNNLYEWIVYDDLIQRYGKEAVKMKSVYEYQIADEARKAEPDFIVTYDNEIIVIDAKWKVLKSETKISFDDVAKLWRDEILTEATRAILIYPQIEFAERNVNMSIYNKKFQFKLEEKKAT